MTCSTSNMKAVFQSVNIDFEIIFRLYVCLLLCILYNIQLKSRNTKTYQMFLDITLLILVLKFETTWKLQKIIRLIIYVKLGRYANTCIML